ncbi:MAG: hypothetical protein ABJK11_15875 [Balneola sp.]
MKLIFALTLSILLSFNGVLFGQETKKQTAKKPIQLKSKSATAGYYTPEFGYSGGSTPSYTFRVGYFGIEQKVSHYGDNLKEIVKDNPEALKQMNIYARKRKNMVVGAVIGGSGIILVALGLEKTDEQAFDPNTGQLEDRYGFKPIGIVGMSIAVTGFVIAAVNGSGATKYIERAVKAYNKGLDLTSEEGETVMKINFAPTINPSFVGAGFKVSLF